MVICCAIFLIFWMLGESLSYQPEALLLGSSWTHLFPGSVWSRSCSLNFRAVLAPPSSRDKGDRFANRPSSGRSFDTVIRAVFPNAPDPVSNDAATLVALDPLESGECCATACRPMRAYIHTDRALRAGTLERSADVVEAFAFIDGAPA